MPQLQSCMKSLGKALIRRKPLHEDYKSTQLDRCLSTLDLTALGVGSTLGLGIYVLAGQVASEKAGPSVTLSFLIAAIASVFAGLCYAEFGARVPRAGSAYVYSYVTVGEFMAFVIGWNLILEYVIGTASVARGYSGYIDYLVNGTIRQHLEKVMPINLEHVSTFPDFLAFGITMALTAMLAVGVRESSRFNNIFTCLNLLVVVFAVIGGSFKADVHNWKLEISEIPTNAGNGGFLPFGISGMMSGAATCFYGFIGFDCIATTGEEVKNPQKAIPISIVLSLFFVFLAYFGVSAVQTMMCPYYLQNNEAPLPFVFEYVGWPIARWIVAIGALAGLSTSLLGAMFPLPRVLYAMATDGVVFRFLANVHPRFKTPLIATAFSGLFSGCMAMMFKVHELADMMSIGTLLAYSLVAISVLVLRYQSDEKKPEVKNQSHSKYKSIAERGEKVDEERNVSNPSIITDSFAFSTEKFTFKKMLRLLVNADAIEIPSYITSRVSIALIVTACILIVIFDALLATMEDAIANLNITLLSVLTILLVLIIVSLGMLYVQPVEHSDISFKVPLVPFIPMLSVFVNVYLMFKLSTLTWERFGVWMAIGFCVYFFYGLWHSSERKECIDAVQNGTVPNEACLVKTAESPGLGINGPKGSIDSRMSELTVNGVNLEVPSKMSNSDSVCVNTPF